MAITVNITVCCCVRADLPEVTALSAMNVEEIDA